MAAAAAAAAAATEAAEAEVVVAEAAEAVVAEALEQEQASATDGGGGGGGGTVAGAGGGGCGWEAKLGAEGGEPAAPTVLYAMTWSHSRPQSSPPARTACSSQAITSCLAMPARLCGPKTQLWDAR